MDCSIVIPVFNQLSFTADCLKTLNATGVPDARIVIVNNASTDGTKEFLDARSELRVIHNPVNHGCCFAWTQGAKASSAVWTVILNNDVLIAPGWLEGMVSFGEEEKFDVVSPAMCHGEHDYDLTAYAQQLVKKMSNARREGVASGVCFMVHRRVFDSIGFFDGDPRLGGYEDDEFFRRARKAGFRLAITGRAFLHHFGSITQKSIQKNRNRPNASLGDRAYYRQKYGLTWFKLRRDRVRQAMRLARWRLQERWRYGETLQSRRIGGVVEQL